MSLAVQTAPVGEKVTLMARNKRATKQTLTLASHTRNEWSIITAPGVTQDDVRASDFWFNIAPQMRRLDIVSVWAADRSWEMETCIERVRGDGCDISVRKVYGHTSETDATEAIDDGGKFVVEYRGPEQWCVRRTADGILVQKNHPQKANAVAAWRSSQPRRAA